MALLGHHKEDYLQDLNRIDWNAKLNNLNNNISQTTNDVIKTIEEISNKHAPIKALPRSKLKQFTKPWITNGILKSIKTKPISLVMIVKKLIN